MQPSTRGLVPATLALAISVLGGTATASEAADPATSASPVLAASIDEPFTLPEGAVVMVDEALELTFVEVLEESRCPSDVQCVWEGNARISLEAMTASASAILQLDTNLGFETSAWLDGFRIELLQLEPYPDSRSRGDDPYEALLIVRLEERASPTPRPSPPVAPAA